MLYFRYFSDFAIIAWVGSHGTVVLSVCSIVVVFWCIFLPCKQCNTAVSFLNMYSIYKKRLDILVTMVIFSALIRRRRLDMILDTILSLNLNFDTYNSLTPNWYYKVLR